MRRLLLAASLFTAVPAFAQSQAANPVEVFSYGQRSGTAASPLWASVSPISSASAQSSQAATPVELFSYGQRFGTKSNPINIQIPTAPWITQSQGDARYVQLSGDVMIVPFGTPASSSAACTKGQLESDATYFYTCIATNMWHRVSNGATW